MHFCAAGFYLLSMLNAYVRLRSVLHEQLVSEEFTGLVCDLYEQHNGTLIAHMEISGSFKSIEMYIFIY